MLSNCGKILAKDVAEEPVTSFESDSDFMPKEFTTILLNSLQEWKNANDAYMAERERLSKEERVNVQTRLIILKAVNSTIQKKQKDIFDLVSSIEFQELLAKKTG